MCSLFGLLKGGHILCTQTAEVGPPRGRQTRQQQLVLVTHCQRSPMTSNAGGNGHCSSGSISNMVYWPSQPLDRGLILIRDLDCVMSGRDLDLFCLMIYKCWSSLSRRDLKPLRVLLCWRKYVTGFMLCNNHHR